LIGANCGLFRSGSSGMAASMLVKQRHLSRIVGRRRGLRRRLAGALRVGRLAARNRRLDAVGGRVAARRPAFLARALCPPSVVLVAASCDGLLPILWDGMRRLPLPEEARRCQR
jgi:hypothetical protein